jgi:hypothetical protein
MSLQFLRDQQKTILCLLPTFVVLRLGSARHPRWIKKTTLQSLMFLVLFCATLFGQAPTIPNNVPYENHGTYAINLQNLSIPVNIPIREKSGTAKFSAVYSDLANNVTLNAGGGLQVLPLTVKAGDLGVNGLVGQRVNVWYSSSQDMGKCPNQIDEKIKYTGWYVMTADGAKHPLPSSIVLYEPPVCAVCRRVSPIKPPLTAPD